MSATHTVTGENGFKFFTNSKIEQGFVLINKYGAIRFKKELAEEMKFTAGSKWLVGVNENEEVPKFLYIIKSNDENEQDGYKMAYLNKSWFITCRNVLSTLKISFPAKCRIEKFKDDRYEGIRIALPTNFLEKGNV